jgi:hypothetical protein
MDEDALRAVTAAARIIWRSAAVLSSVMSDDPVLPP